MHLNLASTLELVVLSFVMITFPSAAKSSEINSLQLTIDGSFDPPGDRIDAKIELYREVRDASVEVIAFLVEGDRRQVQNRVRATDKTNSDRNGDFRLTVPLRKNGRSLRASDEPGETAIIQIDEQLIVPYRDFKIPLGSHQLGYVVRLIADDEVVDIRTKLTKVNITNGVRKQFPVLVPKLVPEIQKYDVDGYKWSDNKLIPITIREERNISRPVFEAKVAEVNVPGEFNREETDIVPSIKSSKEFVPESRRTVYFATNREVVNRSGNADTSFSNESVDATDRMTFGECLVSIPIHHHVRGTIEQPGHTWLFWEETPDPEKHFLIERFDKSLTFVELRERLGNDDILVFVHGYSNSLKDSVLRAAQLQHDLEFGGKVIAFSWPSAGATLLTVTDPFNGREKRVEVAYKHDENVAARSSPFFAELISNLLREKKPGQRIHVLAHSMGNRVVLLGLHALQQKSASEANNQRIEEIILAAADIDGSTFANARSALLSSSKRITFYYASDDQALMLSRTLHQDKPIGMGPLFDESKMDTISAEKLTAALGSFRHAYYGESKPLLTDLRLLLSRGLPPLQRRPPLGPRIEAESFPGLFYWTFLPER